MKVRSGETPRSPVAKPPASVEMPASKRGGASGRSATSSEACNVVKRPGEPGQRGSRTSLSEVKAREGVWDLGADTNEPSGVGGVERSDGCRGNWRGPPRPVSCGDAECVCLLTGDPGKWQAAERESEGVVVVTTGGTT